MAAELLHFLGRVYLEGKYREHVGLPVLFVPFRTIYGRRLHAALGLFKDNGVFHELSDTCNEKN